MYRLCHDVFIGIYLFNVLQIFVAFLCILFNNTFFFVFLFQIQFSLY